MRRRNTCAGTFRDPDQVIRMIGKVIRGANVRRLLYYLYGPGKGERAYRPAAGRRVP